MACFTLSLYTRSAVCLLPTALLLALGVMPCLALAQAHGLVLRSSQPSWLEVRGSGERVLFRGTLRGEQRFALDQPVRVLAGRPDLVTVVVAGGTPRPLGRIQDIRWVVIRGTPGAPAR